MPNRRDGEGLCGGAEHNRGTSAEQGGNRRELGQAKSLETDDTVDGGA